jgi:hypothetical protein
VKIGQGSVGWQAWFTKSCIACDEALLTVSCAYMFIDAHPEDATKHHPMTNGHANLVRGDFQGLSRKDKVRSDADRVGERV